MKSMRIQAKCDELSRTGDCKWKAQRESALQA
jgi:hypothetical protein